MRRSVSLARTPLLSRLVRHWRIGCRGHKRLFGARMTGPKFLLFLQVDSLSFHLVQISPVTSYPQVSRFGPCSGEYLRPRSQLAGAGEQDAGGQELHLIFVPPVEVTGRGRAVIGGHVEIQNLTNGSLVVQLGHPLGRLHRSRALLRCLSHLW